MNWAIWRPVVNGKVTLQEIETYYDVNDMFDLHEVMDLMDEAERKAHKIQEMKAKATAGKR